MARGRELTSRQRAKLEAVPRGQFLESPTPELRDTLLAELTQAGMDEAAARAFVGTVPCATATDFLSTKLHDTLLRQLTNARLDKAAARAFVEDCGKFAQMVHETRWRTLQAEQRRQLNAVGKAAVKLRDAIEALDERVSLHWQQTLKQFEGSSRPLRSQSPLAQLHTMMSTVETVSEAAAGAIDTDRRRRLTDEAATGLAFLTVRAFRDRFGELPPSGALSWFPPFMKDLGSSIGLDCKREHIVAALKDDAAVNGAVKQIGRAE